MNVISVNVGLPRRVSWKGRTVSTGIFKSPASGRVPVRRLNLDGDRQADLSVHGGPDKAVYAYPTEHYRFWEEALALVGLPVGAFGENLTTEGVTEETVHVGDRLRIGTAEFVVTQPRVPCYKLALRFKREDMVRRFLHAGRYGFYLAVLQEGDVAAGDPIEIVAREEHAVSIAELMRLYLAKELDPADLDALRRAIAVESLPRPWRDRLAALADEEEGAN